MTVPFDPEIAEILAAQANAQRDAPKLPPGDPLAIRAVTNHALQAMFSQLPSTANVTVRQLSVPVDGDSLPLLWYVKDGQGPGSAVVYVHGGGMICGSAEIYDRLVRHYVECTGVPFLSVDYRLAPEHAGVGLSSDVLTALKWLHVEVGEMGVDPQRIALMGDSGGGGVAAAAAIRARDQGLRVSRQILIFPMLDDRNITPDPLLASRATWTYEHSLTAWGAVLGDRLGAADVSPYVAPARLADFTGLPSAYIEVGELDILRDESVLYAQKLFAAGVSCELHVLPGAPHGYDWFNHRSGISRRVLDDRVRVIQSL